MKQIRMSILLIATCMLLCACPDNNESEHRYITILNQSDKAIVWQPQMIRNGETNEQFDCRKILGGLINRDSLYKFNYDDRENTWEVGLNNHYLQIIVMEAETFDKYIDEPCDTIRKYVPVLHTYQLTFEDLQQMNWMVVYPPGE